jgi:tetratricopeptide (TPR) repeat protein
MQLGLRDARVNTVDAVDVRPNRPRERLAIDDSRKLRWKFQGLKWLTGALFLTLLVSAAYGYFVRRQNALSEADLALAREAIDQSLASADRDPEDDAADLAQTQKVRDALLEKAERFYLAFVDRSAFSEAARRDLAIAHLRLGDIHRIRRQPEDAAGEYQEAIDRFDALAATYSEKEEYWAALGNSFQWLGETYRQMGTHYPSAAKAFDSAFLIQQRLVQQYPNNAGYQELLARTHYNRGRLRTSQPALAGSAHTDFREAVRLLEPLATSSDRAAQALARAYHHLGTVLAADLTRAADVQQFWERGVAIVERLVIKEPANREYKLALANFCGRLAALLNRQGNTDEALRRSQMAIDLFENLSRTSPSLAIARADAHDQRGVILQPQDSSEALASYEEALNRFSELQNDRDLHRLREFHFRLGELLLNLAAFPKKARDAQQAREMLTTAVNLYAGLAGGIVTSGSRADAQTAVDNLARVLPALPDPERAALTEFHEQLKRRIMP